MLWVSLDKSERCQAQTYLGRAWTSRPSSERLTTRILHSAAANPTLAGHPVWRSHAESLTCQCSSFHTQLSRP